MSKNLAKIIFSIIELILPIFTVSLVSAKSVDYSVTVEPALNITTTGDTNGVVTLDLNPETHSFDSKNLTVTVGTNNETGYKLYVNTTGNTTNLVEKNDSNLYIETLASEVSENNFTPNRWGYKLNSSSTNYIPFVSGTLVNSSNTATAGVSSTLTFGAKANYDTKAGSYALALNFQATANPHYKTIADAEYMQYVSSKAEGGCPSTLTVGQQYSLTDSRDGQIYTVTRLGDGNCWMTRDIAIGCNGTGSTYGNAMSSVTLTSDDSNVASDWATPTLSADKTANTTGCTTSNTSDCNSFTTARMTCHAEYGGMYNTAASTVGTVTGSGNWAYAGYDICPKGWRLPTLSELGNITSYSSAFLPKKAGYYHNGVLTDAGSYGYWPSSTPNGVYNQGIRWNGSTMTTYSTGSRADTGTIRCILK